MSEPTFNAIDLLDCANGNHNMDEDDTCKTCGYHSESIIREAEVALGLGVKIDIHSLVIDDQNSTTVFLFRTDEEAKEYLYSYVKDNWDVQEYDSNEPTRYLKMPIPQARHEAIDKYFENSDEWYVESVDSLTFYPSDFPQWRNP